MLGRLKMDIDEAIKVYRTLAQVSLAAPTRRSVVDLANTVISMMQRTPRKLSRTLLSKGLEVRTPNCSKKVLLAKCKLVDKPFPSS